MSLERSKIRDADQQVEASQKIFTQDCMIGIPNFIWSLLVLGVASASYADPGGGGETALAGRYYLSGMREVGSELVLHEDGTFHWSAAYGALDQEASGEWSVDRGVVTLTPRARAAPVGFKMADLLAWDSRADEMQAVQMKERSREQFRQRCPIAFLQQGVGHTMSDAVYTAPPTEEELLRAKEFADFTRNRAQSLLDRLAARSGWQGDPKLVAEIDSVLDVHAQAELRRVQKSDSARAAGMAVPAAAEPLKFPAACDADDPKATLAPTRGALVAVFDPESNSVAHGFTIEAAYDRGPPAREILGPQGVASFPLASGRRIVALTIAPPDGREGQGRRRFPVAIVEPAIQLIHTDLPRTNLPFERLHLAIEEDGRLRPIVGLRGHYVRSSVQ
ncbi:hypothetical protein ACBY01_15695 [Sphingomonas sp. ac-8]|uniref:hypothetical protein n=1 Tax=Sphingomonas sp. ac-8 TaxID=3242977 RepID=UPI003A804465